MLFESVHRIYGVKEIFLFEVMVRRCWFSTNLFDYSVNPLDATESQLVNSGSECCRWKLL